MPSEGNKHFVNDNSLHEFAISNYKNITLPWIFCRLLEGSAIPKPSYTFGFVDKRQQTTVMNIHETSIIPLAEKSKDTSDNNEPIELVLEDTGMDNTILEPLRFEPMDANVMHVSHSSDEDKINMINSSEPNEEEDENINLKIRYSILCDSLDERLFRSKSFMFPLIPAPASDPSSIYTALKMTQMISTWVMDDDTRTVISLDLDLYLRAYQLVQSRDDLRNKFIFTWFLPNFELLDLISNQHLMTHGLKQIFMIPVR